MEHSWNEIIWNISGLIFPVGIITMAIIEKFWPQKISW
jgi:hypothetical protein